MSVERCYHLGPYIEIEFRGPYSNPGETIYELIGDTLTCIVLDGTPKSVALLPNQRRDGWPKRGMCLHNDTATFAINLGVSNSVGELNWFLDAYEPEMTRIRRWLHDVPEAYYMRYWGLVAYWM